MRIARENAALAIVNTTRNPCAAVVFALRMLIDQHQFDVAATHRYPQKACRADSESRFLAMKIFSWSAALRLIVARQNRIFARIAVADSQARDFGIARSIAAYGEQLMHARAHQRGDGDDEGVTSGSRRRRIGMTPASHRMRFRCRVLP
jgi:hypothetical protein